MEGWFTLPKDYNWGVNRAEVERLRQQYAELLVEMERIADVSERWEDCLVSQINEIARAAIAKATGGE